MKKEFDFDRIKEAYLSNTISIFQELIFCDDDRNKVTLRISDIENIIPHAKSKLIQLCDIQPNSKDEVYNWLEYEMKEVRRKINDGNFELKEERLEILNIFQSLIREIFNKSIVVTNKLIINASQSVIFDFIQQLKTIYINGQTPFLSQTNEELAEFLINNIEGFENSSLNTITKELARKKEIKKAKLKVVKIN